MKKKSEEANQTPSFLMEAILIHRRNRSLILEPERKNVDCQLREHYRRLNETSSHLINVCFQTRSKPKYSDLNLIGGTNRGCYTTVCIAIVEMSSWRSVARNA